VAAGGELVMNDAEALEWAGSDRVIVAMPEEIDITNSARVCQQLNLAFLRGVAMVVADFTATRLCDSSGARELALAHGRAIDMNVELRAVVASAAVLRVFELTGLSHVLPVYTSREAALSTGASLTAFGKASVPIQG